MSGPVSLNVPSHVDRISIDSAEQMHLAVMEHAQSHDIFIACAAVADFRPSHIAEHKLKKTSDEDGMTITMIKNPDIVASVAALTEQRPFTVGFAAETQEVEKYARAKLERKNLDMICANDVSIQGQGFNSDDNALHLYWKDGNKALPLTAKSELGKAIMLEIAIRLKK